eukprot:4562831-Pyramimonas_sp.AAC.1
MRLPIQNQIRPPDLFELGVRQFERPPVMGRPSTAREKVMSARDRGAPERQHTIPSPITPHHYLTQSHHD